jgi:hypothetical protein
MAIVLEIHIYQNSLSGIPQGPRVQSIVCTPNTKVSVTTCPQHAISWAVEWI